jgi:hypothetical protein
MQHGIYSVHNDQLSLMQMIGNSEYRYDFYMRRNNALPVYKRECDFLDMWWAGFKVEDDQMVNRSAPHGD